jgi:hypothetical protein
MLYPAELRARLFLRSNLSTGPHYQSWLAGATLRTRCRTGYWACRACRSESDNANRAIQRMPGVASRLRKVLAHRYFSGVAWR